MKQGMKRLLCLVLTLVLVLGLVPQPALALLADQSVTIGRILTETDHYINPLYADTITQEDLVPLPENTIATAADEEPVYHDNFADAAVAVREGMEARETTIVTYYRCAEYVKEDHSQVYQAAIAHTGVPTEGDSLRWVFGGYNVSISRYQDADGMYCITYTYTMTYYTTAEQEAELTEAVDALLAELDLDGLTDYRKLRAVYDYICETIVYDDVNSSDYKLKYTAYAALVNKTSVCQGYALLLYRLLLELGIDTRLIAGTGNGGAHGWNIVKLGDVYYNVDATWDATYCQAGYDYPYFLVTDDNFTDHVRNDEYLTAEFSSAYPMTDTDYAAPTTVASGQCGDNLTWTLDSEGLMEIQGTGEMYGYMSAVETPWYNYIGKITALVVREGITSIGSYAFLGCAITELSLPDSLQTIEGFAFSRNPLTELTIPAGVASISWVAFGDCTELETIRFLGDAPEIRTECFRDVTAVCYYPFGNTTWTTDVMQQYGGTLTWKSQGGESVCIKEGTGHVYETVLTPATEDSCGYFTHTCAVCGDIYVEPYNNAAEGMCGDALSWSLEDGNLYLAGSGSMADYASPELDILNAAPWYSYRSYFTGIVFNGSIDSIGDYAFYDADNLTSVEIPDGITSIGEGAFAECSGLEVITFTGDAPAIGTDAFKNVTATVYYPAVNPTWTADMMKQYGGTLTWVSYTTVLASGQCGDNLTWTLTEDCILTIEGTGEMYNYSSDNSPWNSYLDNIHNVIIHDGATSIGSYAFEYCSNLTSITIPEGITSIGDRAFWSCRSLTSVTIPEGVTSIGMDAFCICSSLTSITIPEGVTSIGDSAFSCCSSLTSINIPGGVTSIGARTFNGCCSLTSVTIPEGVTFIGDYAFDDCSSLTSINIPEGVTSIEVHTFYHCSSLTSVTIPEGVTSIGYNAFSGCSSLTSITIPESVTSIGDNAFENCTALTSVTIPDGVTSIEENTFSYCSSLTSVNIPESVTSIGDFAFYDCSSLTSVNIPESVTSIGDNVFSGCSSITGVTIPESVTSIGDNAFSRCSSLTSITIPESVTSIEDSVFYNCSSLTSVTIPRSVTSVGIYAFQGCSSLTEIRFADDAPTIDKTAFTDVAATAYYPAGNATWTADMMQDYGGTITWVLYGQFDIPYASMTMGNSLAINFAFEQSAMESWDGCYAQIVKTYADGREDVVETVAFADWKSASISGVAHYYVTFNGIAAKEMTDSVCVTIYNAEGVAVSNTKTDSVRDQSMRALAKDGVTDGEKTMIVDMLNYGAAAQEYFSYGADDLANSQLSDEQQGYASTPVACTDTRTGSGAFKASTVVLKSNIQMMFAFTGIDTSHYAVVTFSNHRDTAKEITVSGSEFGANGTFLTVTVDALVVADGRQDVTCVVYDADGNEVASVTDSLASYTARNNGADALFTKMMQYSDSAYSYFHS